MADQSSPHEIDRERLRRVLDDDDIWRDHWDRQHDHWWDRSVNKLTSAVGKWVIVVVLSGAGGAILIFAAQHGWFK